MHYVTKTLMIEGIFLTQGQQFFNTKPLFSCVYFNELDDIVDVSTYVREIQNCLCGPYLNEACRGIS